MKLTRRVLLKSMLAFGTVLALPRLLFAARPDRAFEATGPDEVITDLFGAAPVDSDRITLKIPDIAENGAVVPVTISTDLADVESISVIVEKNPTPLAAMFVVTPRMAANVSVRIKMGESSPVHAVVKAAEGVYRTSKEVKVTIGGCGG